MSAINYQDMPPVKPNKGRKDPVHLIVMPNLLDNSNNKESKSTSINISLSIISFQIEILISPERVKPIVLVLPEWAVVRLDLEYLTVTVNLTTLQ